MVGEEQYEEHFFFAGTAAGGEDSISVEIV
jgi:hypothetical protein